MVGFKELVKVGAVQVCPLVPPVTVKVRLVVVVVATPLQLLERTTIIGNVPATVGVPEIALLLVLKDKPAGRVEVPRL